ncbi:MAG: hydroxymethylbilane synthase, partial [Desulfuromusa sp.]|nr:hydroxymethylbilane synthase [Desulfuromusa sp.]
FVKASLESLHPGIQIELVKMVTKGDKILDTPLAKVGGKGLFVKELEQGMLNGDADIAVHSMKDVPTFFPDGTGLRCITEREDPRDIVVLKQGYQYFSEIRQQGRIGTSSLRRKAQLLNLRPDLEMVDIRGNVQTRITKLKDDNLDAVVLAAAGMHRLGFSAQIGEYFDPKICLPAIGQGALGLESRLDDNATNELIDFFNHLPTSYAVTAERAVLATLEGGCQVPIAAFGTVNDDQLELTGLVSDVLGQKMLKETMTCHVDQAVETGVALAKELLSQGAAEILNEVYGCDTFNTDGD